MKIFKVNSNKVAFDEDESMIIIAKSKNRALEIALKKWEFRVGHNHNDFNIFEIDLSEEKIISISHYGD